MAKIKETSSSSTQYKQWYMLNAPTSDPSDDEAEVFYEEMEQTPVTVIPIHNVHNHNLRNQNAYYIQHVRTNCREFTIHYTGPIFWNTLPQQLREAVSENQFKRKLKELFSLVTNSTI